MFQNVKLNGAKKELTEFLSSSINIEELLSLIGEQFSPEDVFSESSLDDWALENGYKKES